MGKNIGYEKAFGFAVRIVNLYKYLNNEKKEFVLAKQVLRSGTSIGANIKEGIYGQSDRDMLSKFSIALKEASETEYWIELLFTTEYIDEKMKESLMEDLTEILKILTSSVKKLKNR